LEKQNQYTSSAQASFKAHLISNRKSKKAISGSLRTKTTLKLSPTGSAQNPIRNSLPQQKDPPMALIQKMLFSRMKN